MIRLPKMDISRNCIQCGTNVKFEIMSEDYDLWKDCGVLIQEALWYIPADQREMLLSGICGACWDKMFAEDSEEDSEEFN
jgi:hypothetical protein